MSKNEKQLEELALVLRSLADVWQNDRDEITVAGATFEKVVEELDSTGVQLNKLIDLAWKGMRHLYEEDHYFLSVKNATMQGVNAIREYLIKEGNITVEEFESSCDLLEKALDGKAESADKVIELDENNQPKPTFSESVEPDENRTGSENRAEEKGHDEVHSLNELASLWMDMGDSADLKKLEPFLISLNAVASNSSENVQSVLKAGSDYLAQYLSGEADSDDEGLFNVLSEKIETALKIQEDEAWGDSEAVIKTVEEGVTGFSDQDKASDKKISFTNDEEPFLLPDDIDLDMVKEFVAECNDLIDTAESALLDLEDKPGDSELINSVFRAFHTIKGTSAFMGLDPISEFTHYAETLLSMVREGELSFDRACADISFDSIDIIKKLLAIVEVSGGGDPLSTSENYLRTTRILHYIADDQLSPAEALEKAGIKRSKPVEAASDSQSTKDGDVENNFTAPIAEQAVNGVEKVNDSSEDKSNKTDVDSTVRVNLGRLDRLIDMVGELVIAHSVVSQDGSIAKDSDLMKKIDHASKILRELQDNSLTLRMVPLKATFHKMNRLVRDLTRKAGKEVKLSTIGDDTEIDRNMVDIINEPLVHMLRNSIDHGVEPPEERAKSGKPAVATVWLRAYQEGGKVVIEIEDDGKGIDREKILKKAIEKGLVHPEKRPTDSEICGLIFHPGLSSTDKVTDLSGRGVGMDVVKRSIDQLQGKVEVESVDGKGTKVSLELPFTLAITDGMLVRVGEQRFIIPTINIDMTFRSKMEDIFTIMGKTEHVKYRGVSVPIIRLHKLFNVPHAIQDLAGGTLVIVNNNNHLYALLVDEIIGQQQLVGKSINMNVKMPHISGGAILGDGKVGLILDTAAVAV